jgi:hypothetical protein
MLRVCVCVGQGWFRRLRLRQVSLLSYSRYEKKKAAVAASAAATTHAAAVEVAATCTVHTGCIRVHRDRWRREGGGEGGGRMVRSNKVERRGIQAVSRLRRGEGVDDPEAKVYENVSAGLRCGEHRCKMVGSGTNDVPTSGPRPPATVLCQVTTYKSVALLQCWTRTTKSSEKKVKGERKKANKRYLRKRRVICGLWLKQGTETRLLSSGREQKLWG